MLQTKYLIYHVKYQSVNTNILLIGYVSDLNVELPYLPCLFCPLSLPYCIHKNFNSHTNKKVRCANNKV